MQNWKEKKEERKKKGKENARFFKSSAVQCSAVTALDRNGGVEVAELEALEEGKQSLVVVEVIVNLCMLAWRELG